MVDCTPDPNLLESMRSVGYNLNTAIADIIDNSIAANAESISIRYFDHGEDPYMAIIDDGDGMDYETAVNAMKLAGTSPNATRNNSDLGRFGLGLKTASLSQARSVMVSTVQNGHQHTLRWDLDHVAQTHTWDLETMDERQTSLEMPEKYATSCPAVTALACCGASLTAWKMWLALPCKTSTEQCLSFPAISDLCSTVFCTRTLKTAFGESPSL